ncbi:MAG TPA: TolC family protein, partial [Flavobacteriales bacterium]|nr:TolC family protein [Flavobacteriales bacterium]
QFQQQRVAMAQSRATLNTAQVRRETAFAFLELQAARERQRVMMVLDSSFQHFANYAQRKVDVGESPLLEALSARAQWERIRLDRQQADADVAMAEGLLAQWLGTASIGALAPMTALVVPVLDSALVASNPELRALQQNVEMSKSALDLQRSQWTPSLKFGGFAQSLDHVTPRSGILLGVSIPLIKTGQAANTKAAMLDARIAEDERLAAERAMRAQLLAATQDYLQRQREYAFYADEGAVLADAIVNNAAGGYEEGELGYLEYMQTVGQANDLRVKRIASLLALDRSVIQLDYLTGR